MPGDWKRKKLLKQRLDLEKQNNVQVLKMQKYQYSEHR